MKICREKFVFCIKEHQPAMKRTQAMLLQFYIYGYTVCGEIEKHGYERLCGLMVCITYRFSNRSDENCTTGQVRSGMGAYAGAARRRVHFATVLPRPPSGHRPGRRQARIARILQIELHLTQP